MLISSLYSTLPASNRAKPSFKGRRFTDCENDCFIQSNINDVPDEIKDTVNKFCSTNKADELTDSHVQKLRSILNDNELREHLANLSDDVKNKDAR